MRFTFTDRHESGAGFWRWALRDEASEVCGFGFAGVGGDFGGPFVFASYTVCGCLCVLFFLEANPFQVGSKKTARLGVPVYPYLDTPPALSALGSLPRGSGVVRSGSGRFGVLWGKACCGYHLAVGQKYVTKGNPVNGSTD